MVITKPPMGWNSWNTFGDWGINETVLRETADAMISTGLAEAGYNYICIDDGWEQKERTPDGKLVEDFKKFPHGLRALADYIHSKGLKFGIYSAAGTRTCADYPGSFGHEFDDVQTFLGYDIDYLKYDNCMAPEYQPYQRYNRMGMALESCGRDILFSVANCGTAEVETWARSVGGHMYRSTGDIGERFSAIAHIGSSQFFKLQYSAPGCYNDVDMLVVGMDGVGNVGHPGLCGDTEYKTHFALWCMESAPLIIGSDLRRLRPECIALLKNKDLLAIDQDPEARAPLAVVGDPSQTMLFKHLSGNRFAVGIFNLSDHAGNGRLWFDEIGMTNGIGFSMRVKDVFTGEIIDRFETKRLFPLEPHDCRVFIGEYVPDNG